MLENLNLQINFVVEFVRVFPFKMLFLFVIIFQRVFNFLFNKSRGMKGTLRTCKLSDTCSVSCV